MGAILAPILPVMRWRGGGGGGPEFGAPRSKTVDGKRVRYPHDGVDVACSPGESVLSPVAGVPVRVITCYTGDTYRGLEIVTAAGLHIDLLYLLPLPSMTERELTLEVGDVVGIAQDISRRYPPKRPGEEPMEAHIHVRVWMRWADHEPEELADVPTLQKRHTAYGCIIRCYDPAPLLGLPT